MSTRKPSSARNAFRAETRRETGKDTHKSRARTLERRTIRANKYATLPTQDPEN